VGLKLVCRVSKSPVAFIVGMSSCTAIRRLGGVDPRFRQFDAWEASIRGSGNSTPGRRRSRGVDPRFWLWLLATFFQTGGGHAGVAILLRFSQRTHAYVVFFQPTRDRVRVAPFVLFISIDAGDLHRAQLLFDILLNKPVSILVERFRS
jgi:hypothetical protein